MALTENDLRDELDTRIGQIGLEGNGQARLVGAGPAVESRSDIVDLKISMTTHDLEIDSAGRLETVDGTDEGAQGCMVVLSTQQGEWDYDLSYGVPWRQIMSTRPPQLSAARGSIIRQLLRVPEVDSVPALDLAEDPTTRELTVSGTVISDGVSTGI